MTGSRTITTCVVPIGLWALASAGLCGTFIDDFSDASTTESTWEVVHRDWIVADGTYSSPGEGGLTQCPISLLPIEVEDGMVIVTTVILIATILMVDYHMTSYFEDGMFF